MFKIGKSYILKNKKEFLQATSSNRKLIPFLGNGEPFIVKKIEDDKIVSIRIGEDTITHTQLDMGSLILQKEIKFFVEYVEPLPLPDWRTDTLYKLKSKSKCKINRAIFDYIGFRPFKIYLTNGKITTINVDGELVYSSDFGLDFLFSVDDIQHFTTRIAPVVNVSNEDMIDKLVKLIKGGNVALKIDGKSYNIDSVEKLSKVLDKELTSMIKSLHKSLEADRKTLSMQKYKIDSSVEKLKILES